MSSWRRLFTLPRRHCAGKNVVWQALFLGVLGGLSGCAGFTGEQVYMWLPGSAAEAVRGADDDTSAAPALTEPPSRGPVAFSAPANPRDHVYVFVINGLDPFHYADVPGLAEYIRNLGFEHVFYSEFFTAGTLLDTIERSVQNDPQARIVVIGYSFGANAARNLVHSLGERGIDVDLLVYLNGNTLRNTPWDRPSNVQRVLNILAWGILLDGAQLDNAENIEILDAWHFNTPTHPLTLELIQRELTALVRSGE